MSDGSSIKTPDAVIGLEIHCQLTRLHSKLFCSCKADYRGMTPNENICPICAGLPGTLPRLNGEAVRKAAMISMALNCDVPEKITFFRKNYFYPDLPKNFQITQLNMYGNTSMGGEGSVFVDGKKIRIRRVQLEEDPGRMVYEGASSRNMIPMVDYNRAGTALVEIVTEPDFEGPRQVRMFLQMLSDMMENLGISDPGLEGAMRADANVSLSGGPRVEIKNINSFHDLEKAVIFETTRQEAQYSRGLEILQETRHWDAGRKITVSSRLKEQDVDYRYLLEADIPWVMISTEDIARLQSKMPESVDSKRARYVEKYDIPAQVADVLSSNKFYSDLFDDACTDSNARVLANIVTTDLMGMADSKDGGAGGNVKSDQLKELADAVASGVMARNSAKRALYEMVKTGKGLLEVSSGLDIGRLSDESVLEQLVSEVISEEEQVAEQAATNPQIINYLVGKVMKKTSGKADPKVTMNLFRKRLSS